MQAAARDHLFVCTDAGRVAVLRWEGAACVTVAAGDLAAIVGVPPETGILAAVAPGADYAALVLVTGVVKIIPIRPDGTLGAAVDFRLAPVLFFVFCCYGSRRRRPRLLPLTIPTPDSRSCRFSTCRSCPARRGPPYACSMATRGPGMQKCTP